MASLDLIDHRLNQYCSSPYLMRFDLSFLQSIVKRLLPQGLHCLYVLVGGTNAKGSTVKLLAHILQLGGYRVGSYTSPHLKGYCERIGINQQFIDQASLLKLLSDINVVLNHKESLTFFEFLTLSALVYFEQQFKKGLCDIAILEVGLGGRLDATNIVEPILSIITTIGLDHCHILGDTIQAIGQEKAGIMRKGKPAIFVAPDVPQSVTDYARAVGAKLLLTDKCLQFERFDEATCLIQADRKHRLRLSPFLQTLDTPLCLLGAYHGLGCLSQLGFSVSDKAIEKSVSQFALAGRRQTIFRKNREFLLDVGHNRQAVDSMLNYLKQVKDRRVFCIFYALDDKPVCQIMTQLKPHVFYWYIVHTLNCEREPTNKQWQVYINEANLINYQLFNALDEVLRTVYQQTTPDDLIVVLGSFVLIGEALDCLGHEI